MTNEQIEKNIIKQSEFLVEQIAFSSNRIKQLKDLISFKE
jgi:hypothetical protein